MIDTDNLLVPSGPVFAYLELTYDCNNKCPDCSASRCIRLNHRTLNLDEWKDIFRKLASHVSHICLTGGEPTIHRDFPQIISLVDRLNIRYSLFTNGRWLKPRDTVRRLSQSSNLTQIFFSLHGIDPESHDAFTGVSDSFQETCGNIALSAGEGLPVTIDMIITSRNYNRIPEIIQLSQQLGAGSITFSRYVTAGENAFSPSDLQLHQAIASIEQERKAAKIPVLVSVCIPRCFHQSDLSGPCLAGIVSLVVDPWGNVRPCVMVPLTAGNLLLDSLDRVWWHDTMRAWRTMIPESCMMCVELSECRGGCRAASLVRKDGKDNLIGRPLKTLHMPSPCQTTLDSNLCPRPDFTIRKEPFGYLLISGTRVVPVIEQAIPLLQACDGTTTLQEIQGAFGQEGLNFIALLYLCGLIKFR